MKTFCVCVLVLLWFKVNAEQTPETPAAPSSAHFEELISKHGANANLLYNLANTYYQKEEYGLAVHAYEQARAISPLSADIANNLALARKALGQDGKGRSFNPLQLFSLSRWSKMAATCLVLLSGVLVARNFWQNDKAYQVYRWLTIVCGVTLLIAACALVVRKSELNRAVVTASETMIRLSPFVTADKVGVIKAGHTIQVKKEHQGFFFTGNGWVSKQDVRKIYQDRQ